MNKRSEANDPQRLAHAVAIRHGRWLISRVRHYVCRGRNIFTHYLLTPRFFQHFQRREESWTRKYLQKLTQKTSWRVKQSYSVIRWLRSHVHILFVIAPRLAWWGALSLWAFASHHLLTSSVQTYPHILTLFGIGLAICTFILLFTSVRKLQIASGCLALGHGSFAVLTWLILHS